MPLTAKSRDKDPIIGETWELFQQSGLTEAQLAEAAGITSQTLWNWFHGPTRNPQIHKIRAVLQAMGYDLRAAPSRGHNSRRSR